MICVLGATYKELSLLLSSIGNVQPLKLGKSCLWWGEIKKQKLIVALTGIGPVNAAYLTTLLFFIREISNKDGCSDWLWWCFSRDRIGIR